MQKEVYLFVREIKFQKGSVGTYRKDVHDTLQQVQDSRLGDHINQSALFIHHQNPMGSIYIKQQQNVT